MMKKVNAKKIVKEINSQFIELIGALSADAVHALCISRRTAASIYADGSVEVFWSAGSCDLPDSLDRQLAGFAFYLPFGGHHLFMDGCQGDPDAIKLWLAKNEINGVDVDSISNKHEVQDEELTEALEELLIENNAVVEVLRADLLATLKESNAVETLEGLVDDWMERR